MSYSFYFYDLETSGVNSRKSRIMQFAGQRTNANLEPIGEPDDILIQLNKDILPEPEAVLLHGITPQRTMQDGITEAEFVKYFDENILKQNTIFVGFNNVRFDDEFMRFLFWRNFHDPYEWQWKDGCSRWDILDLVRITRALRPDGINWPVDSEGKASNRLELLTGINKIDHVNAHTALSDVTATIAVAKLIKEKQPKLFDYMLDMRDKKKIRALVSAGQPFVYVSGRYESRYEKMTVVAMVAELEDSSGAVVFDLRYNPETWAKKTDAELEQAFSSWQEEAEDRLPFKVLQYNRCPSVAPMAVIDEESKGRLAINVEEIEANHKLLKNHKELIDRVTLLINNKKKSYQTELVPDDRDADERLYEGFVSDSDRELSRHIRELKKDSISSFTPVFSDARLKGLYPLYKARNFSKSLNPEELAAWGAHVEKRLFSGGKNSQLSIFMASIGEIIAKKDITKEQKYLLEELRLYAESIVPSGLD